MVRIRRFLVKRLIWFPIYFILFSFVIHFFVTVAPGDPVYAIAGNRATEEVLDNIREEYGLNRPQIIQYFDYMGFDGEGFIQGEFGESFKFPDKTIPEIIGERVLFSMAIGFPSVFFISLFGIGVGLLASWRKGSRLDTFLISASLVPASVPALLLVQFAILLFAVKLGWFPASWEGDWTAVFSTVAVIPIGTMVLTGVAGMAIFVRTITLNIIDEGYILAAKVMGVHPFKIVTQYVLRNASLPLITVLIPMLFGAFEGSFFIERIYGIPGLANFALEALFARDYPVILFLGIWGAMLTIFVRLIVDILYMILDPRADQ